MDKSTGDYWKALSYRLFRVYEVVAFSPQLEHAVSLLSASELFYSTPSLE